MGASPSCDYSEYVPKTEYDQQKSRTLARLTACQDTNKPGKCNFSKFIASTNAYINFGPIITQTECEQRQTCEKSARAHQRPRRLSTSTTFSTSEPLLPSKACFGFQRGQPRGDFLLCIHLHVVPDRSNTAQKCVDGPPSLGLHLLRVARHMPSHV